MTGSQCFGILFTMRAEHCVQKIYWLKRMLTQCQWAACSRYTFWSYGMRICHFSVFHTRQKRKSAQHQIPFSFLIMLAAWSQYILKPMPWHGIQILFNSISIFIFQIDTDNENGFSSNTLIELDNVKRCVYNHDKISFNIFKRKRKRSACFIVNMSSIPLLKYDPFVCFIRFNSDLLAFLLVVLLFLISNTHIRFL